MSKKTFTIVSLGCRTNQYEAQGWRDQLLATGHTEDPNGQLCIVNTCTVTHAADKESRQTIKKLAKGRPDRKILVTGCASDGDVTSFESLPQVSHVARNKDKHNLLKLYKPQTEFPEFAINNFEGHTRAFVKVQDGCNSFCTYCIIPYVRGRSRSRKVDYILREVESLIENGYKEVVLTGINIGDFDGQDGTTLAELVREVDGLPGLKRLRLSSIDPDEVDDTLLRAIIDGKNTSPSMHIVLQSGSNVVLKRMNRKYTRQIFLETCERLKSACPDFTFTTDVIVGFPGETERDFQETLDVMERVQFAKVHMFPYSPRKRTRAALYEDQIPKEVMDARRQTLLRLNERYAYALREKYIGRTMTVLTEGEGKGHTDNFLPVLVEGVPPNELVDVTLVENRAKGLVGRCS